MADNDLSRECLKECHTPLCDRKNSLGEMHGMQATVFDRVGSIKTPRDENVSLKNKRSKRRIQCLSCHKHGHHANRCPEGRSNLAKSFAHCTNGEVGQSFSESLGEHHTPILCLKCHKHGHYADKCPEQCSTPKWLVCFACGKTGHSSSECLEKHHTPRYGHHNAWCTIFHHQATLFDQVDTINTQFGKTAGPKEKSDIETLFDQVDTINTQFGKNVGPKEKSYIETLFDQVYAINTQFGKNAGPKEKSSNVTCFKCGEKGHHVYKCTNEDRCIVAQEPSANHVDKCTNEDKCNVAQEPSANHVDKCTNEDRCNVAQELSANHVDKCTDEDRCNVAQELSANHVDKCTDEDRCNVAQELSANHVYKCTNEDRCNVGQELSVCCRCGEIGHHQDQCTASCPSCDEDHPPGECPVLRITCHLCEGQDHYPKGCPLKPILAKATKIHHQCLTSFLASYYQ